MFARLKGIDLLRAAVLALVIALVWCVVQNRLTLRNWHLPLFAASDGLSVLAGEKAAAEGNVPLILPKINPHLGAPYSANWNDFPGTEDPLFATAGLLTKCIGIFAAGNLLTLLAHVLAALSFFIVCRTFGYGWQWAFVGSLAFGLSRYAFQRGFPHLGLTYYWHIPLCLLVCAWAGSRRGLGLRGGRFWIAMGIGLLTGIQNVYYTSIFLQFLGFAAIAQAIRRQPWKKIIAPILIGTASVCGFVLMNLDTFYYQAIHGINVEAATRTYQGVERYALKPLDLLIPPPNHRSDIGKKIAWNYMYGEAKKVYVVGEPFSQYLGLFGISALLWLGVVSLIRISRWPSQSMPSQAAQTLWIILYSVMGGVNGLLGQLGINLFRCTNRFSIYIMAIVLLFAVKRLDRLSRSWHPGLIALMATALAALILWDQLPPTATQSSLAPIQAMISSDRAFAVGLEKALTPRAMVFQLPAMRFPESWPIAQMGDYEHFRPYLYSNDLHFSYGDDKGRGRDDWQFSVEKLPAEEMIAALERYGFAAIYINRKGYDDNGVKLIDGLQAAGRTRIMESPAHDLVSILLSPSDHPVLPETPPQFKSGWYSEEGNRVGDTWHCSSGNAELTLHNSSSVTRKVRVEFELASYSTREVEIAVKGAVLYKSPTLNANRIAQSLILDLPPCATTLLLKTQPPVTFPGSADTRVLGFVLYNLHVIQIDQQ